MFSDSGRDSRERACRKNGLDGGGGGGHREVGAGAAGIHRFRADLDVESCWLGRGPLH